MILNGRMHSVAEKMRHLEPIAQIWMQIDPYYQRQKSRPVTLESGNICCMHDIRGGSSWRGHQMRVGLSTTAMFGDLNGYFFGNFREKASNIIWRYATPCWPVSDWLQNEWPRMTLSGYLMSKSVFGQHFLTQCVWLSKIIVWKVTNIDPCYHRQKCRYSSFSQSNYF